MPDMTVTIGGRDYTVACREGEEHFLQSAARMLDAEAQTLIDQIGRMPEARMLLMAGLMLADRTAGMDDQVRIAQDRAAAAEQQLSDIRKTPPPSSGQAKAAVLPAQVEETMAMIAARAEELAERVEARAAS
ncbi:MAG: cell division protein ZapA [Paracoccaceae bacterium]